MTSFSKGERKQPDPLDDVELAQLPKEPYVKGSTVVYRSANRVALAVAAAIVLFGAFLVVLSIVTGSSAHMAGGQGAEVAAGAFLIFVALLSSGLIIPELNGKLRTRWIVSLYDPARYGHIKGTTYRPERGEWQLEVSRHTLRFGSEERAKKVGQKILDKYNKDLAKGVTDEQIRASAGVKFRIPPEGV